MKLTVLTDNNTFIDRYFKGEPGLSFLIEEGDKRFLFDTGYSGIFLENALKMGIDLLRIDGVVLSHGHMDHTWGLEPLIRMYTEGEIESRPLRRPVLTAHPGVFDTRTADGIREIGCLLSEEKLTRHFEMQLSAEPLRLTDRLYFLGEIERTNEFENRQPVGQVLRTGGWSEDFLADDTALAYRGREGLVIITGCSHAGICNIIEQAVRVTGEERIRAVVGGLHLLDPPADQLAETADYLRNRGVGELAACHCTDLASRIALAESLPLVETGVGLVLDYT